MAHVTALAAARHSVFARAGWDVGEQGLIGAPPVRVLAGAERHITVDRALRLLGFGTGCVTPIPADAQGRMLPGALREAIAAGDGPAIVCAQAGNVNTGAFDPLDEIADIAEEAGAWLHIDGAFGLWAAASPAHRHLVAGSERADSWAVDAHKWLNVPYDSGIAFCAHPEAQQAAMGVRASYLIHADPRWSPRRAGMEPGVLAPGAGFPIYAAIRSLGRSGIAELIERCCAHARRFAEALREAPRRRGAQRRRSSTRCSSASWTPAGDHDAHTDAVIEAVQRDGTCWLSGTTWQGMRAMRISVSSHATTGDDVDQSIEAILRAAAPA